MSKLPDNIREYLNKRLISDAVIESAHIGYDNNRIEIPVFDKEGKHLFSKFRKDPTNKDDKVPKYTYTSGSKATIYNLQAIKDNLQPVYITEGELDALCLTSFGFQAVSSTGGSGTFLPEWADYFKDCEVFLCYDRDRAGIQGVLKAQQILPNAKCIFLPDFKGKDVTDYMLQFNRTQFLSLPAENWFIPEPDKTKGKQKQIDMYSAIANRALAYKKEHLEFEPVREIIVDICDKYKSQLKTRKILTLDDGMTITNIKQIPITRFIKFNTAGFAECIWHKEKTASLKYYPDRNSVYCYGGCGNHDVIDVVQKLENLTTAEAINYLNKML